MTHHLYSSLLALTLSLLWVSAAGVQEAAEARSAAFVYVEPIGETGWTYQHDQGRQWLARQGVKTAYREALSQQQRPFTHASLHGQYAIVGTGGNHTAASLGIETYDGQGNVTRTLLLNEHEADHTRKVVTITGEGIYQVQPNGMGTATIVNTLPDGSTFTSHVDFVITQAAPASTDDEKVATAVFAILRETGMAASLVTFVLTRLPD